MPQLQDTCIRHGNYDEALDLESFMGKLAVAHANDVPAVRALGDGAKDSSDVMLAQLLGRVVASLHSRGASDWWPCATRTRLMGCTHSRGVSGWLHVRPELDLWVALTPRGCQVGYMCHQNSTYGLHALPGGVRLVAMEHTGCHQMVF